MKTHRFLIVFAKEPRIGHVKTRLNECLSEKKAVGLYKSFLQDTLATGKACKKCARIIAYHAKGQPVYLKKISQGYTFHKQRGASLGHRLHNAFVYAKNRGADRTVIIGSDAPDLPVRYIEDAFRALDRHDVVFGPSKDGGYYLVALKKPMRGLFQRIQWSTGKVLRQSVEKAQQKGKRVHILKTWRDIDTCDDLQRLKRSLKAKKNTAEYTRRFLYGENPA